jgi:hypothetical protein
MKLKFIKGSMGGNEIILSYGFPDLVRRAKRIALKALRPPYLGGHQLGFLWKAKEQRIRVKIFDKSNGWIGWCGGLAEVLGKSLVELPELKEYLEINPKEVIHLQTDSGEMLIRITKRGQVWTDLSNFAKECYKKGIEQSKILGTKVMKIGEFLVINADEIKDKYPQANFEQMDGSAKNILTKLQAKWQQKYWPKGKHLWNFSLFDLHPTKGGDVRAVFPHSIQGGHIEPTCGTGSIAIALTMVANKQISEEGIKRIMVETGNSISLGGPEKSTLKLLIKNRKVKKAEFTHNKIRILAKGEISI